MNALSKRTSLLPRGNGDEMSDFIAEIGDDIRNMIQFRTRAMTNGSTFGRNLTKTLVRHTKKADKAQMAVPMKGFKGNNCFPVILVNHSAINYQCFQNSHNLWLSIFSDMKNTSSIHQLNHVTAKF